MTQSVYVIGGAGTGKSTFMADLLRRSESLMGPLTDLRSEPNSRGTVITLRGHALDIGPWGSGMYLGCMRDEYPGTDGLDRVSYIPGESWLLDGPLPDWIVAEGATLAARRFLHVLHATTDLLLVHLVADDFVKELRFGQRGSTQKESFVTGTATRADNLVRDMNKAGVKCWNLDSSDPDQWAEALEVCCDHLS